MAAKGSRYFSLEIRGIQTKKAVQQRKERVNCSLHRTQGGNYRPEEQGPKDKR